MSEETKVETQAEATQAPEAQNVNISVDQILAAVLKTQGPITVKVEDLVANYSTMQISVNQNEDQSIVFALVDAPVTENQPSETVQASE